MRKFFYPSNLLVIGVGTNPRNLGKTIIANCQDMGFKGEIFAFGQSPGTILGREIITDPKLLPDGIDLAVILVPAPYVAESLEICGRKGIHHVVISTAGFREYNAENNSAERDVLATAKRYGIRFIGPNCIGVICTNSALCTPFGPLQPKVYKKGRISLIAQSGGITSQAAYQFSEEYVGFSKIISAGNKLNLDEIDFIKYLMDDEDTDQIYLHLESIGNGRELIELAKKSKKPIVVYKTNVSRAAAKIAMSHTAALSNDDRVVDGALRQGGIVRVQNIHDMTVCAKALSMPPLRGDNLMAVSVSGGFSVIIGDVGEKYGFKFPPVPRELMDHIESFRRGGVIRMSNPMDFGDVHEMEIMTYALEHSLALDEIDGVVLSFLYDLEMERLFGTGIGSYEQMLKFLKKMSERFDKPIALSFFTEREQIEKFKEINIFPVFNDAIESVRALRMLRDYWRGRNNGSFLTGQTAGKTAL